MKIRVLLLLNEDNNSSSYQLYLAALGTSHVALMQEK